MSSSFKLNEGIALVGGKSIKVMGIDPGTGKVLCVGINFVRAGLGEGRGVAKNILG